MKDGVHLESPRSGVCSRDEAWVSEWGNPTREDRVIRKEGNEAN
jgi:hypothetical protein